MIRVTSLFPAPQRILPATKALLELCEDGLCNELLRFLGTLAYFVVLGYANQARTEVNLPFCKRMEFDSSSMHRWWNGPAGPCCLNYSAYPAQ